MDMDEARLRICRVVGHISLVDGRWVCDACGAYGDSEDISHSRSCPVRNEVAELCTRMYNAGAAPITDIGMNAKMKLGSMLDEDQHRTVNELTMHMVMARTPESRKEVASRIQAALPNIDRVTLTRTANTGLLTPQAMDTFRTMLMATMVNMSRGR